MPKINNQNNSRPVNLDLGTYAMAYYNLGMSLIDEMKSDARDKAMHFYALINLVSSSSGKARSV